MRMEFSLAKKGFHFHSSFHTAPSPIFFIFTHFKSFSFPLAHPTWALHKGRRGILESGLGGEQCWGLGRDRGDQSPVKMGRRSERGGPLRPGRDRVPWGRRRPSSPPCPLCCRPGSLLSAPLSPQLAGWLVTDGLTRDKVI